VALPVETGDGIAKTNLDFPALRTMVDVCGLSLMESIATARLWAQRSLFSVATLSGYTSFRYDISEIAKPGTNNLLVGAS